VVGLAEGSALPVGGAVGLAEGWWLTVGELDGCCEADGDCEGAYVSVGSADRLGATVGNRVGTKVGENV